MDIFLDKITQQAVNYAIRSGVTLTASYALRQTGRLMSAVQNSSEREELHLLQDKLQSKIRIISPAIDMIELISARGNTTLESAIELTTRIRSEIQAIALRLEKAATDEDLARRGSSKAPPKPELEQKLRNVISDLKRLLSQIEDAVPFLNLALTTSGAKLSTDLPPSISPSRLLQASTFLTAADSIYARNESSAVQVGPTFTLCLYMLFAGHVRAQNEEEVRASTWKEVLHKARLKLMRVPLESLGMLFKDPAALDLGGEDAVPDFRASMRAEEYAYQLVIIEDFDDDRVHEFAENEPQPEAFEGVQRSGIKEAVPIHEVSKIFYADTGKILNIGDDDDTHRPVLLLKRDKSASTPRRMISKLDLQQWDGTDGSDKQEGNGNATQSALDAQLSGPSELQSQDEEAPKDPEARTHESPWMLPCGLDPEWLAFEVYTEATDSDEEDNERTPTDPGSSRQSKQRDSLDSEILSKLANVNISSPSPPNQTHLSRSLMLHPDSTERNRPARGPMLNVRTSLSLLEVLLRLTSLQQFQQATHLSIEDEFLNFFLSESATAGSANGDEHERRAMREDAKRRVGFDPYNESPIKRRGEEYQYRGGNSQAGWDEYQDLAPSIESPMDSPRNAQHVRNQSGSEFPPMRLRNSPARSSRHGTPEKIQPVASPGSVNKPSTRSKLSTQVAGGMSEKEAD